MRRLRSVAVVALLWFAALAASSTPAGFHHSMDGGPSLVASHVLASHGHTAERDGHGKRWAVRDDPGGKRWCAGGPSADA